MYGDGSEQQMGSPLMHGKDIELSMRPQAPRAVANRDQQPKADVARNQQYCDESGIGREVECGHRQGRTVTARKYRAALPKLDAQNYDQWSADKRERS